MCTGHRLLMFFLTTIGIAYAVCLVFPLPNMGGSGLSLPLNIITWTGIVLVSLLLLGRAAIQGRLLFTTEMQLGLVAAVLMTVPILWTPAINYSNALPRIFAIWGIFLFSLSLRQVTLTNAIKSRLLYAVVVMALFECGLALFQWGWPDTAQRLTEYNATQMGGRPYGIFQQPNLLASFVATGYGVAVWLSFSLPGRQWLWRLLLLCQGVMLFTLGVTASRVGLFGALLVLFLLGSFSVELSSGEAGRQSGKPYLTPGWRCSIVLLLLGAGVVVNILGGKGLSPSIVMWLSSLIFVFGMVWGSLLVIRHREVRCRLLSVFAVAIIAILYFLPPISSGDAAVVSSAVTVSSSVTTPSAVVSYDYLHSNSSAERLNILWGTLHLIALRPCLGIGLGGYESAFSAMRMSVPGIMSGNSVITHPHNEPLYVLAEGGIIALAGLFMAGVACLLPALKSLSMRSADYDARNALSLTTLVLMLPIILHIFLEYPLYQSAPHLLVLLLLVRVGQRDSNSGAVYGVLNGIQQAFLFLVSAVLIVALIILIRGVEVQNKLTWDERGGQLTTERPLTDTLTQYERYDFDVHTRLLLDYNRTQDSALLDNYFEWGEKYLKVHSDRNVYHTLIQISEYRGDIAEEEALKSRARAIFPQDELFSKN